MSDDLCNELCGYGLLVVFVGWMVISQLWPGW